MLLALVAFSCIVAAAASGVALGLFRARQTMVAVIRSLDGLDLGARDPGLDPAAFGAAWSPLVARVNRLVAGRQFADLAAREAVRRAREGDGRTEQLAAELVPAIADLREAVTRLQAPGASAGAPDVLAGMDRVLGRLATLLAGVTAGRGPDVTGAGSDLCAAVRTTIRSIGSPPGIALTLDLDERACPVRAAPAALERMADALIRHAVEGGAGSPARTAVGVYVRRIPRVRLEEPQVRRVRDPGLTIHPRRPNPRLERWLREGRPPAEVVKFVVAGGGVGVLDDVERRLNDPAAAGGAGLTLARRTIECAGGTVWVQRAREGGAALHVCLPLEGEAAPAPSPRVGRRMRLMTTP